MEDTVSLIDGRVPVLSHSSSPSDELLGLLARLIAALVHELVADVVTASGVELVALGDDRSARGFGDDGAVDIAQDVVLAVAHARRDPGEQQRGQVTDR